MPKTATGEALKKYIKNVLSGSTEAGEAAIEAGYPELSTYTKQYLKQLPRLKNYGDRQQRKALERAGQLYKDYGKAGEYKETDFSGIKERYKDAAKYDKTKFSDFERKYGEAGKYKTGKFTKADYKTKNIQERMSPYEKLVSEQAQKRLKKGYDEARGEREAQAARAGAFGGSGAAIQEEAARRNYLEQSAQMNAQNLQNAYDAAVNLYGKEVADRLNSEQLTEASRQYGKQTELAGIEGAMAARGMTAEQVAAAKQAELAGISGMLSAQQQTAAQRAAAKEAEFAGLQGQQESARQQALLAEQRKNMQLTNLAALQQGGQYQQDYNLAQRMYPLDVYARQSAIMGGMSGGYSPLATTKQQDPSLMQNIMGGIGAGIGVLQGVGNLFRDGGIVYRGGGLAELEPEYYDQYER